MAIRRSLRSAEGVASITSLTFSLGDHLADLLGPEHLDAVHHLARERGIVVDEGDGLDICPVSFSARRSWMPMVPAP